MSHLDTGTCDDSRILPTLTMNRFRQSLHVLETGPALRLPGVLVRDTRRSVPAVDLDFQSTVARLMQVKPKP